MIHDVKYQSSNSFTLALSNIEQAPTMRKKHFLPNLWYKTEHRCNVNLYNSTTLPEDQSHESRLALNVASNSQAMNNSKARNDWHTFTLFNCQHANIVSIARLAENYRNENLPIFMKVDCIILSKLNGNLDLRHCDFQSNPIQINSHLSLLIHLQFIRFINSDRLINLYKQQQTNLKINGGIKPALFRQAKPEVQKLSAGRPMVHPPSQTVTAKEGESLDIVVEFCAEPRHTKVLWMSEKNVYVPGAEARDGVQALAIEHLVIGLNLSPITQTLAKGWNVKSRGSRRAQTRSGNGTKRETGDEERITGEKEESKRTENARNLADGVACRLIVRDEKEKESNFHCETIQTARRELKNHLSRIKTKLTYEILHKKSLIPPKFPASPCNLSDNTNLGDGPASLIEFRFIRSVYMISVDLHRTVTIARKVRDPLTIKHYVALLAYTRGEVETLSPDEESLTPRGRRKRNLVQCTWDRNGLRGL
ncbi:hypothetical protein WN51_02164 [Melipona quadrifasciata]|uniref:Uncharacterized protein n=1 Tax=Melipona quadrifasciata TaxID=166423 RepID=A0A0M8ZTD4_9HYME|nr:hypothetical protein WN51_02164 [Melipona quadrifasciata]